MATDWLQAANDWWKQQTADGGYFKTNGFGDNWNFEGYTDPTTGLKYIPDYVRDTSGGGMNYSTTPGANMNQPVGTLLGWSEVPQDYKVNTYDPYGKYDTSGALLESGTDKPDPMQFGEMATLAFLAFVGGGAAASGLAGGGVGATSGTSMAGGGGLGAAGEAAGSLGGAGGLGGAGVAEAGAVSSPVVGGGSGAVTATDLGVLGAGGAGAAGAGGAGGAAAAGGGAGAAGGAASWLGTAGKVAGALAPLVGGAMQANASEKAADQQAQSAQEANDLAWRVYQDQKELQAPFRQAGLNATNRLQELLGIGGNAGAADYGSAARDFTIDDFYANRDPGYQFRMDEGRKALENSAASRGRLFSGATGKALTQYGQNFASGEYQNAYNRHGTNIARKLNPLQAMMGSGQTSANTLTGAAGQYGQTAGNNITAAGNAQAAGTVGQSNAWSNALTGAWNQYQQYQQQEQMQPYYNALVARLQRP